MGAEIYLANVIFFDDSHIAWVRGIMSSAVVDTAACREGDAGFNFICLDETSIGVFDLIANIDELHARLDYRLRVFPDLSVALCRLPEGFIIVSEESLLLSVLCFRCSLSVVILSVFEGFILRELAVGELLSNSDGGRVSLLEGVLSFCFPISDESQVRVVLLTGCILNASVSALLLLIALFLLFLRRVFLITLFPLTLFLSRNLLLLLFDRLDLCSWLRLAFLLLLILVFLLLFLFLLYR